MCDGYKLSKALKTGLRAPTPGDISKQWNMPKSLSNTIARCYAGLGSKLREKALERQYTPTANSKELTPNYSTDEPRELTSVGVALRTYPRQPQAGVARVKRPEVRLDGKANAITTVPTDSMVCSPIRLGHLNKGGQGDRIYSVKGKSVCLSAKGGGRGAKTGLYKIDLPDGDYVVRKLTPIEAERLQTLDDNFTALGIDTNGKEVKISNSQRYKAVGNGWNIETVALFFKNLPAEYQK